MLPSCQTKLQERRRISEQTRYSYQSYFKTQPNINNIATHSNENY